MLFYSWADVMAYDRMADQGADDGAGDRLRTQAREMFRFAEADGCRHGHVVGYFGEQIEPCGTSCDRCLGEELGASLRGASKAIRKAVRQGGTAPEVTRRGPAVAPAGGEALFAELKALRSRLAQERQVPAYVVFSDATLVEMAASRPRSHAELLSISGVGTTKLERYGDVFLAAIARFTE